MHPAGCQARPNVRVGRRPSVACLVAAYITVLASCTDNSPVAVKQSNLKHPGATARDMSGSPSWTTLTPIPTPRVGPVAAVLNGTLYVFGGYTGISGVYWNNPTADAEAYDPATNTWTQLAPLPYADAYMDGAVAIGGKIYVIGGVNGSHSLRIYDPLANSWSTGPDRPVNSLGGSVVTIDEKLYVLSGYYGESKNDFYTYDPSTGVWTRLPGSPNVHLYGAYGVINDKFYIAGGEDGNYGRYMNVYDPATNAWTVGSPMPAQLWDHPASGVVNGKLYAISGGIIPAVTYNGTSSDASVYDPATDAWTPIVPTVSSGGAYTGSAGAPIAFSGASSDVVAPIPTAVNIPASGVINGTIYVVAGGDVTNTIPLSALQAFTPPGFATLAYSWDFGDGTTATGASATHLYTSSGTYTATLTVTTPTGRSGVATSTVTISSSPPTANAGGPYAGSEGSPIAFDGTRSSDPAGYALSYTWDFGDGSSGSGATPTHAYADNGTYTVKLTVTDGHTGTATASTTVTVANAPPTVGGISAPLSPVQIGSSVSVSATYTDPGTLDTHTATIAWGDGTTSAATVTESNGSGIASGAHVYASAGVYTLTMTVTDKDGGSGSSNYQYVVIYDPSGGFVTGGGWITSLPGAYALSPSATGKATFGFVAKYENGANVPSGNTQFQFNAAGFSFSATSYDWLVVGGAKAQYKGSGTINGAGDYAFMLTAVDGQLTGGDGSDTFRIKIWDKTSGAVIYDNQSGASDESTPTTALGGGSVIIHK